MNKKLLQLFAILSRQNFVSTFEFHQVIYNNEATQEDKDAFIAWTNDNNLKIISGRDLYIFATDEKDMLSTEELKEMMYDVVIEKEEPQKIFYEELKHIRCTKFDSDYPCGWLNQNGDLTECDWGDHELIAGEYIRENGMSEEQDKFEKEYGTVYSNDFLVYAGWVLFDCPSGNCQPVITFRKGKLTKKQKDYIMDYLLKMGDSDGIEQIFPKEEINAG